MEETPAAQWFPVILTIADVGVSCAIRTLLECVELLPINVLRALSPRRVNTSLSGTLFF
jgi:hypothetical protein